MFRRILSYGIAAGLIVGVPLSIGIVRSGDHAGSGLTGMTIGYTMMLVALSLIFIAIKRQRDVVQGGVIRFWTAFGMGLAISVVASLVYVAAWEATQAIAHFDFADMYARQMIAHKQAAGAGPAEIARVTAEAADFRRNYANPLWRLPMSFMEIFPVGVLVSLVAAGLLRNSRFLPARKA